MTFTDLYHTLGNFSTELVLRIVVLAIDLEVTGDISGLTHGFFDSMPRVKLLVAFCFYMT